jgi:hypothetical protein
MGGGDPDGPSIRCAQLFGSSLSQPESTHQLRVYRCGNRVKGGTSPAQRGLYLVHRYLERRQLGVPVFRLRELQDGLPVRSISAIAVARPLSNWNQSL